MSIDRGGLRKGCRRKQLQCRWRSGKVTERGTSSSVRIMLSKRMELARHIGLIRERENTYRSLVGKPEEKRPLKSIKVGVRIILKWIKRK
jgi:hypothetical protein